jgi:hypothetical protein
VSDIFQEVVEEVRRERLKQVWERYSGVIVGVALLIILGLGGWRGYQWWEAKKAAEAGAVFESAVALANEGKRAEAEAAFGRIASEASSGYRVLARLRQAAELATHDREGAVRAYDALANDSSVTSTLRDLANVRAALLLVDAAPLETIRARLEPLTAAGRPFRHTAREVLAFAAFRAGDMTAARPWLQAIVADPETPPGVRARTDMLMALAAPEAKS